MHSSLHSHSTLQVCASGGCQISCSPTDRIRHMLLSKVILSHPSEFELFLQFAMAFHADIDFYNSNARLPFGALTLHLSSLPGTSKALPLLLTHSRRAAF